MAVSPSQSTVDVFIFFGTCPTRWTDLSASQQDTCIGQTQLRRRIEGHYAWPAAGELLRQWNESGYDEYSAVLKHKNEGKLNKLFKSKGEIVARPLLYLLSISEQRYTARPFIVVSAKSDKAGEIEKTVQDAIALFRSHPRLCTFGFKYMAQRSALGLSAGTGEREATARSSGFRQVDAGQRIITVESQILNADLSVDDGIALPHVVMETTAVGGAQYPTFTGLSGVSIRVYRRDTLIGRAQKPNIATISGVIKVGDTRYALTAAHIFFDNFEGTESWALSGLYANGGNSSTFYLDAKPPRTSGPYEVILGRDDPLLENYSRTMSLGLFTVSSVQRNRSTISSGLPQVILDPELDWALVELRQPRLWMPTQLQLSAEVVCSLLPPVQNQPPPAGRILLATGVSGVVTAVSLGSVGGLVLPWSRDEIKVWVLECDIGICLPDIYLRELY
jgi:hypothetical protein